MVVSVVRAFFHSGGLKAGTPLEMASTPVRAVHPELNAFNTRKKPRPSTAWAGGGPALPGPSSTSLRKPPAIRIPMARMNR